MVVAFTSLAQLTVETISDHATSGQSIHTSSLVEISTRSIDAHKAGNPCDRRHTHHTPPIYFQFSNSTNELLEEGQETKLDREDDGEGERIEDIAVQMEF